ncbi:MULTISPECIES: hypothetical protein [unclassified Streptomyces]|uniref:hypothetical protein n=1 Tax=unclassified Streptomyces TaxID=2593676 RepID=UPI00380558B6
MIVAALRSTAVPGPSFRLTPTAGRAGPPAFDPTVARDREQIPSLDRKVAGAHRQQPVAAVGLVLDVAGDQQRGALVGQPPEDYAVRPAAGCDGADGLRTVRQHGVVAINFSKEAMQSGQ